VRRAASVEERGGSAEALDQIRKTIVVNDPKPSIQRAKTSYGMTVVFIVRFPSYALRPPIGLFVDRERPGRPQ
jgi:hypothetical protein